MTVINEKNFLGKLLSAIPEFQKMHKEAKEDHNIGVHVVFGDFRRLTEDAVKAKNEEMLKRITDFIICCRDESRDEVRNGVYVTFFENMGEEGLQYFFEHLPKEFADDIKEFLKAFDEATAKVHQALL